MAENIHIIDNYKDLCLGDYQDILALSRDESLEEVDRQVKIISILTGRDEDFLLDLPIHDFKRLAAKVGFLSHELPDTSQRLAKSYRIGEWELIPVTDIKKITTAQYIDFQTFHQAGFEEHFVEIISCLLVPKGRKYAKDYDIIEVQDAIRRGLSVYDALTLYGFFLFACRESIKDILTFSLQAAQQIPDRRMREEKVKEITALMDRLQRNGGGSTT